MNISLAHVNIQGINCIVFDADAPERTDAARKRVLADLTGRARSAGLAVEKRALRFGSGTRTMFFGDPDLVRYLQKNGWALRSTHSLKV